MKKTKNKNKQIKIPGTQWPFRPLAQQGGKYNYFNSRDYLSLNGYLQGERPKKLPATSVYINSKFESLQLFKTCFSSRCLEK